MSNYENLNLYHVCEGIVRPADDSDADDSNIGGYESILVAATSEAAALRVAQAYDDGIVTVDNLPWRGRTIAAVWLRDRETQMYA